MRNLNSPFPRRGSVEKKSPGERSTCFTVARREPSEARVSQALGFRPVESTTSPRSTARTEMSLHAPHSIRSWNETQQLAHNGLEHREQVAISATSGWFTQGMKLSFLVRPDYTGGGAATGIQIRAAVWSGRPRGARGGGAEPGRA